MDGKGWFIIYGILALVVVYLFIAQQSLNANVKQLQADVAQLKAPAEETPTTESSGSPLPESSASPDLSSVEGRDAKRKSDVIAMTAALKEFQSDRGGYPKNLQELVPDFMTEIPKDPLSPKYNYRYQRTATGFKLTFYVEDPNNEEDRLSDGKQDRIFTVTERTR